MLIGGLLLCKVGLVVLCALLCKPKLIRDSYELSRPHENALPLKYLCSIGTLTVSYYMHHGIFLGKRINITGRKVWRNPYKGEPIPRLQVLKTWFVLCEMEGNGNPLRDFFI